MRKIGFVSLASIIAAFCVASAVASPAQTFTTLFRFDGTHGQDSDGSLVQGADGNFYGATANGGASSKYCPFVYGCGTVFKMTPDGKESVVYSSCRKANCADGDSPNGALVQGTNGSFYGAAAFGGTSSYCKEVFSSGYGCGTIFEITPTGKLKTLYNFCAQKNCADGAVPNGSLVLGANGNFYGTAQGGGKNCVDSAATGGCGTIFEITPTGKLTTLYSFCSKVDKSGVCTDGNNPVAGLTLATDGNFYGTTLVGGAARCSGCGTVFKLTPAGKLTTLHRFCVQAGCPDGYLIYAGLIQAKNGKFYGTASNGGNVGVSNSGGTVFEITAGGKLTTLHRFCDLSSCLDGAIPDAGLVQGADGNFYGEGTFGGTGNGCGQGGLPGCGTIFKMTPAGKVTTLYNFCHQQHCSDGALPEETLLQGTDGSFYATTHQDGLATCRGGDGCGTIFRLSVGLGPFVQANPNFGKVGAVVDILGNNLTGTTEVTFNGTPATFTVVSNTEITTTVPTAATTGTIKVTTPGRALVSNMAFRVLE